MTDVTPPPAPQSPVVAAESSTEVVAVERKGAGVGIASLLLSLLAVLADIAIAVFVIISVISVFNNFDFSNLEFAPILTGLGGALIVAVIGFFGGIVLALIALLLGIIAIVKNRGRIAGVFGVIFSLLVLFTHGSLGLTIAQSGEALSGFSGLLPS